MTGTGFTVFIFLHRYYFDNKGATLGFASRLSAGRRQRASVAHATPAALMQPAPSDQPCARPLPGGHCAGAAGSRCRFGAITFNLRAVASNAVGPLQCLRGRQRNKHSSVASPCITANVRSASRGLFCDARHGSGTIPCICDGATAAVATATSGSSSTQAHRAATKNHGHS